VHHQNILENYASVIAEVPKIITGERGPQVSDDIVRQAEAVNDFIEQLSCLLRGAHDQRLILNPFGKLVDNDVNPAKASWSRLERPDHVQSLACKKLGCWNGLEFVSWNVSMLGKELAPSQ
jgi:hypothetical protein